MEASLVLQDRFLEYCFTAPFAEHFYLTGGTALARYYFHHRESLDLDLFTHNQDLDFVLVNQTVLGILHTVNLQVSSQAFTDTFIQYIVIDPNSVTL